MWLLARRNLEVRPGRTALFLGGFALAVAVMITLLSVGDAIVEQARDKDLVGGGDLVLVPQGADIDVLKLGGVTAMFSSIPEARFVERQLLRGARLRGEVRRVAATWAGRPVFLRPLRAPARTIQGIAGSGAMPGGPPASTPEPPGGWRPTAGEAEFAALEGPAIYREIDHGHLPDPRHPDRSRWAEWWYFNVVDPASGRFAYLSYFTAGDPRGGAALASLSVQLGAPGEPVARYGFAAPADTTTLALGDARFTVGPARRIPPRALAAARALGLGLDAGDSASARMVAGRYLLSARFHDARTGRPVSVDLTLDPAPRAYDPPLVLKGPGGFESGYAVPVVIGRASGAVEVGGRRTEFRDAPAYHDHNWGYWRAVRWDWGQTQSDDGRFGLVYGAVHAPELAQEGARERRFAIVTAADGYLGYVEPDSFVAIGRKPGVRVGGRPVAAPAEIRFRGAQGADSLTVTFEVGEVAASVPLGDPRDAAGPRLGAGRVFLQMRGTFRVRGRVGGRELAFASPGAAETFVEPAAGAR